METLLALPLFPANLMTFLPKLAETFFYLVWAGMEKPSGKSLCLSLGARSTMGSRVGESPFTGTLYVGTDPTSSPQPGGLTGNWEGDRYPDGGV